MKINERIVELRKREKLSQKELADSLGVTQKTVSYWELGRNEPQISVIRTICSKYEVTFDWLIGNDERIEKITKLGTREENIKNLAELIKNLPDQSVELVLLEAKKEEIRQKDKR